MNKLLHSFIMALGMAVYFVWPFEPVITMPFLLAFLCGAVFLFARPKIIAIFLFGFFYAVGFSQNFGTAPISHTCRECEISGVITDIDYAADKTRIFINGARLTLTDDLPMVKIGDEINAIGTMFPPNGADAPNSYDFAEWAYFHNISATGYITKIDIVGENTKFSVREFLHESVDSNLADTLVLGYKRAVPTDQTDIWKATGVAHVWSISGFHMTLVGGWLFAFFYFIFRSIPPITRRIPARYPAMILALSGLLFYLFLSGTDVATMRAFLMTALLFAAFIFGRNVFSLRNVCIVFSVLLLMNPHWIMEPGFQLSFAAIFGLVWAFSDTEYKKKNLWMLIKALAMTSIVATIFTAPYIMYHFNTFPIYSLIGNLILLPVFSILIMPLVMIGTIASIFGIHIFLDWADYIYEITFRGAEIIANLPYAVIQIPTIPKIALLFLTVGLLCLIFARRKIILTSVFVITAIVIIATNPRPRFYAAADHQLIAFRNPDGLLEFNMNKSSNHYFTFDSWKLLNFEEPGTPNRRIKCERGVCNIHTKNWDLTYIQKFVPLYENIERLCDKDTAPDFIVSYFHITDAPKCAAKILYDGFVIYDSGRIQKTPRRIWHRPRK